MEGSRVTISISVAASEAKDLLDFIMSQANFSDFDLRVISSVGAASQVAGDAYPVSAGPEDAAADAVLDRSAYTSSINLNPYSLRHFLHETDRRIMKFAVDHDGQFYNADLATELGVDTPLTCFPLGRITRKLQKVGVKVDGALGDNWYSKHRTTRGTLLSVRADVLERFREVLHE